MPRFLFNVRDQHGLEQDLEGMDLPDLDAVQRKAMRSCKRRIAACLRSGAPLDEALRRAFEIADEAGQVVLTIPLASARGCTRSPAPPHRPPECPHDEIDFAPVEGASHCMLNGETAGLNGRRVGSRPLQIHRGHRPLHCAAPCVVT
jgi:hypothetical protein